MLWSTLGVQILVWGWRMSKVVFGCGRENVWQAHEMWPLVTSKGSRGSPMMRVHDPSTEYLP
jgi:hypothetical protein